MSVRKIELSVDAQSFDEQLMVSPEVVHLVYLEVHKLLLQRFHQVYESFPTFERMEEIDQELLRLEAQLLSSLVRRGYRYDAIIQDSSL